MNILIIDQTFTTFLSSLIPHVPVFNYFFSFLSPQGTMVLLWFALLLVVAFLEKYLSKKFLFIFIFTFICTFLISDGTKMLFHRHRPTPVIYTSAETCPTNYSFPSTHAAGAFAAAFILSMYDKKRRGIYYLFAILISYSRIYLYCHYFGDVVGGALLGTFTSWLIYTLVKPHIEQEKITK